MSSSAPYALAMIVCDAVHTDPSTGKRTILGTFSVLHADRFPIRHPTMAIYLALTDHVGQAHLKLSLTDVDDSEELAEVTADALFPDRQGVLEASITLDNVVFPRPGEYRLLLHANNSFLVERRIIVEPMGGQPEERHEQPA